MDRIAVISDIHGNLEALKTVLKDIEDRENYKFVKGDIADREFIFDLFESLFIKSIMFLKVSNEQSNIKAPPIITTYIAKSFLYCLRIIVNINVKKAIPITLIKSIIN